MTKRPPWVRVVWLVAIVIGVLEIPLNIVAFWFLPFEATTLTVVVSLIVAVGVITVLVLAARWEERNGAAERRLE